MPSPHGSAQLDLTACDPYGARRVGRARRGGVELPRDAPGRSRRAQRVRYALPEAGRVPCHPPYRRASSTSPPAMGGDRDASAGRGGAVRGSRAGPSRAAEALRQGRARAVQAAHVPRAAAPPMALRHEPAGEDERPARRSSVRGARCSSRRGRCVAHFRSDGTPLPGAGAPEREGVLLVSLQGVIKTRMINPSAAPGRNQCLSGLVTS